MKKLVSKITNWEAWPFKMLYAPIAPVWVWYMLKSRSVWFFTPSNPKVTFGGMDGEPKTEMYKLLPKNIYPATCSVLSQQNFETVKIEIQKNDIYYPCIVKPDIACQGILFRKIDTEEDLKKYHAKMPVDYIIQQLINYPMEVSVFYIRHPQDKNGTITGFLHKIPLQVTGNGKDTLEALSLQHPKAKQRINEMFNKHKTRLKNIIAADEKYMLSYAANHNRGAHFVDLKQHINDELVAVFDEISIGINDFFYGRYDIMCNNVEDLKNGKNFTILEYNGCGAEPNHFYDTGYTLIGAYKEIIKHWKALYQICKYNSLQGIKPWPFKRGKIFLAKTKAHFKIIREADETIE